MAKEKNTCTKPLKLMWYGEYKVNKPNINEGEYVDKEIADKLLKALEQVQKRLDYLISITPTGDLRNSICDDNILALTAILDATE
jgi:hypothetical protein